MKKFICTQCHQEHISLYNVDFGLPKVIVEELESGKLKYESSEKWFIIENKYFLIKGLFKTLIDDFEHDFNWLFWIMLNKKDFEEYLEALSKENFIHLSIKGNLAVEMPFLDKTIGLKTSLIFKNNDSFPKMTILDKTSSLGKMQAHKMTKKEAFNFMESYYHYDS